MSGRKRHCEVPGCGAEIARGKLMCRDHWYTVPRKIRGDVNRFWKAFCGAKNGDRLAAIGHYRLAVQAAVAAVQAQLP